MARVFPDLSAAQPHRRSVVGISGSNHWPELALEAKYQGKSLARICHCSSRQLQRQSLRYAGMSLHRWLDQLRFVEVKQRLLLGQKPKEFANEIGFNYDQDFERYFKQRTGITVMEFLNLIKTSEPQGRHTS